MAASSWVVATLRPLPPSLLTEPIPLLVVVFPFELPLLLPPPNSNLTLISLLIPLFEELIFVSPLVVDIPPLLHSPPFVPFNPPLILSSLLSLTLDGVVLSSPVTSSVCDSLFFDAIVEEYSGGSLLYAVGNCPERTRLIHPIQFVVT